MKPRVKNSEKSRILETKDYSLFNLPDHKISKRHLGIVKESVQHKNLSRDYPILVDEDYNIIEGKYRFLALYESGLPINYKVSEVTDARDAIRIKWIHKNMPLEDVVKVYSALKSYNDLLLISDKFPETSFRVIVLSTTVCNYGTIGIDRKKFDSGQLPEFNMDATIDLLSKTTYLEKTYDLNELDSFQIVNYFYDYKYMGEDEISITMEEMQADDLYFRNIKKVQSILNEKTYCKASQYEAYRRLKDSAKYSGVEIEKAYPSLYHSSIDLLSSLGVKFKNSSEINWDNTAHD